MKLRLTSLLIAASLAIFSMNAQMARLYTSESGLANSQIYDIYQDSRGFIWISTENGLSRFDGMDFSTFNFDRNNSNSIASNLVLSVMEDSRGQYWVGTSAGLQKFDAEENSFRTINLNNPENPESDLHISGIVEGKICGKDRIIAASSGQGLFLIDPLTHFTDKETENQINSQLPSQFVRNIFADSQGRLWIAGDDGGLSVIEMETGKSISEIFSNTGKDILKSLIVRSFCENERTGDILIGTSTLGILIFDSSEKRIRTGKDRASHKYHVEAIIKNNILPNQGEMTYIAGIENGGIKIFDAETEVIKDIKIPNNPYNISNWKIHNLMEDNQGNLWAGVFQTGVLVIPKSMYGFENVDFTKSSDTEFVRTCVTSVAYDSENERMWIGTDGSGLFQMNKDGSVHNFTSGNSRLSNNSIMSLAIDKRGTLWISTYLGGLMKWSKSTGFRQFADNNGMCTEKGVCLAYDNAEDLLYIGTHGHGMSVISVEDEKVIRTFDEDDNKWVSALYLDGTGHLWVGTYNGPMYYDCRSHKLIRHDIGESLSTRVHSFCRTTSGEMWVGTGEGLVLIEKDSEATKSYTEADGLPSNVINEIRESEDGNLWIATMNGLSRFNTSTKKFTNYYKYDGLQENEFHSRASYVADDGKIFFGGINGLTAFYPHVVDRKKHSVPPIYFSDLIVMNEAVDYDPSLGEDNIIDKHITEATELILPYDSNIFSLKFSVLEYTNPKRIVYSYMLEGIDNGWNIVHKNVKRATYTNVPSGKYIMKVKAFFEDSPDEFSYKELNIRVLPPWYLSIWAWIIYALLLSIAILFIRDVTNKRRNHKKEKEEYEIKEMKLQMFTNISHEIRTPLTLVMNPLKKMREAENDPKQKDLYNLMYRNCLRILRLVNQLLDMRKIDNGQMSLHFLETDVVYFIKDIMKSFDNMAVSKDIEFTIHPQEEIINLWIDQGNFDKIIFNLLSNAFKYTPDNGSISIAITGPANNNGELDGNVKEYIEFIVENSGSNVEDRHLDKLFDRFFQTDIKDAKVGSGVGLNLTKMLVELHHGSIKAYNTDTGVAFCVRIPYGCSHLSAEEMTKPTNHKDLYTKTEDHFTSREDITYAPEIRQEVNNKQLKSKKNIILVDDDDEMRAYLNLELKSVYNVETFANARDAWATITTTVPHAIITDLMMDGMDGAELCAKIKKNPGTNHIPVIILTSSGDEQNIQRCIDSGADRFFTKPISLEILKGTIANAIATRDTIRNKFSKEIDYGYSEMEIPDSGNQLIDKVIKVIRENIENTDFSVEDLSHEVGLSRVHLNRKLKEIMNISPSNLIKSMRLKQAAYLLINNKVNISEVAYKVGFSTHSYFSNSFHDYFGMTPKDFVAKYMDCKDEETLKKLFE